MGTEVHIHKERDVTVLAHASSSKILEKMHQEFTWVRFTNRTVFLPLPNSSQNYHGRFRARILGIVLTQPFGSVFSQCDPDGRISHSLDHTLIKSELPM